MAETIRWGILSTARIGWNRVIPAIQKASNAKATAIASRNIERAREIASQLNIETAYGTYEELLADDNVDAIYIPLPNSMHAEWAIKCAEAGKPTLCEKPLAIDAAEAQTMVDTFKERDVLFAEAFMYRFHPRTQRVKSMIEDGAIGEVQLMNASFSFRLTDPGNIRLSKELAGGALMDVGCYCVNSMRFITGEEPVLASAFAHFGKESGVDEQIASILEFPSGLRGHFDASLSSFFVNMYDIRGSEGRIMIARSYTPRFDETTSIHYWHGNDEHKVIKIEPVDQYQLMIEDFSDAVLNKRPPRYDPQDAVNNMKVIDTLLASARNQSA